MLPLHPLPISADEGWCFTSTSPPLIARAKASHLRSSVHGNKQSMAVLRFQGGWGQNRRLHPLGEGEPGASRSHLKGKKQKAISP